MSPDVNTVSSEPYYVPVPVVATQPTVFTSDVLAGILDWSDTPAVIVADVAGVGPDQRADEAAKYLACAGGGWAARYEGVIVQDGRERLAFRGVEENALGQSRLSAKKISSASSKQRKSGLN